MSEPKARRSYGSGRIRQRAPGSWEVTYDLPRGADGKRRQRQVTIRGSKREAQAALNRLLVEVKSGGHVEPSRLTVGAYLEKWLAEAARGSVSAKTFEVYRNHIRSQIVPALGGIPLAKLSPLDVQAFFNRMLASGRKDGKGGLSAQTVIHFHRILHKALEQAVKWQLLARNVCDAVDAPRPRRHDIQALTEAETTTLLAAARPTRLYLPVLLAVATGMRRGEILALRWEDVDLKAGTLAVRRSLEQTAGSLAFKAPKTARGRRTVALPGFALEALVKHKGQQAELRLLLGPAYADRGLVVARPDGSPWRPDVFSTEFGVLVRKSDGPRVRFHDLRHTHASQLFKAGVHPKIVSERLGHSGVGITLDTYSHLLPGMQEDAASRLDAALRAAGVEG